MSRPPMAGRGRGRGGPSLVAAAQAQSRPTPQPQAEDPSHPLPPTLASVPMAPSRSATAPSEASASASSRSTPIAIDPPANAAGGVARMKFKPKVPIRRVKQEVDVKPEITPAASVRGGLRGRGRGAATRGRGRGGTPMVSTSIAAGIFGGPRPATSGSRRMTAAPAPIRGMGFDENDAEVYSDHSDEEAGNSGRPIDIDLVSTMSESAPTSLYRDRRLTHGKAKAKGEKDKEKDTKGKKKVANTSENNNANASASGSGSGSGMRVKDEPISPEKQTRTLPEREDDAMRSDDEDQDRDERGRRVRAFAQTGGNDVIDEDEDEGEGVNEAQKVDLSESEEEEEEEMMDGDFVQVDEGDDPEKKLFIFQFPNLFPKFEPSANTSSTAIDLTNSNGDTNQMQVDDKKDVKPDIKPTPAQLRANAKKAEKELPPHGRVGTLVVMKSGRVKMVMGNEIVMNVTPGLPATFIQHLVHLDPKQKNALVLGEVHKSYVVTPDIDLLLDQLYVEGGKTPGDKENDERRRGMMRRAQEQLTKMELD